MKQPSFMALAVLLAACSTSNLNGSTDGQPTPTEVGMPLGDPLNADIGSSGGGLTSADGAVSLSVPSGDVTSNARFGIQEITNFASGRIGRVYRLSPEGTAFARPVTVQFKLDGLEIGASQPTDVSAAYPDLERY